jgi:hypothetical protein
VGWIILRLNRKLRSGERKTKTKKRKKKFFKKIAGIRTMTDHVFEHTILPIPCSACGTLIEPNPANLCIGCIRKDVDITADIPKQNSVTFCKSCGRFSGPRHYFFVCCTCIPWKPQPAAAVNCLWQPV